MLLAVLEVTADNSVVQNKIAFGKVATFYVLINGLDDKYNRNFFQIKAKIGFIQNPNLLNA